jgi:uncharacterized membrane protein YqgA involved in biofilm formation
LTLMAKLLGTLINAALALLGSAVGWTFRNIPSRYQETTMAGLGLAVLLIGADMALSHPDPVVVTAGMVLGGLAGTRLRLGQRLEQAGDALGRLFGQQDSRFAEGFTLATVVWCVGPLSIIGAIDSGLEGKNAILYTKAILDATSGLFFAQALGAGVLAASLSILVYEGTIALAAAAVAPYLTSTVVGALTNVGGLIVAAIGVNLLAARFGAQQRLPAADFLPALLLAPLCAWSFTRLHLPL